MKAKMRDIVWTYAEYSYFGVKYWYPMDDNDTQAGFYHEFRLFKSLRELLRDKEYKDNSAIRKQVYLITTDFQLSDLAIDRVCQLGHFRSKTVNEPEYPELTLCEYECRNGEWLAEEYIPVAGVSRLDVRFFF